jgi:mono/diheme cytochrome c family protein
MALVALSAKTYPTNKPKTDKCKETVMKLKPHAITLLPLLLGSLFIAACSPPTEDSSTQVNQTNEPAINDEHDDQEEHSDADSDMGMDMDHAHVEAPDEFASLTNPFAGDAEAVAAGKVIFETSCAVCHGPEGKGDGPAAEALDPKPATLADRIMMNTLSDGYLFWRVSKGGMMEPFNSAMPAWESGLTEDQRWQVISYVRSLADGDHMEDGDHMNGEHTDEAVHSD